MAKDNLGVIAVFGNIKIPRLFCVHCQQLSLVIHEKFQCCDSPVNAQPERWKRESDASPTRKLPPKAEREMQLLTQEHRCLYCERIFGSIVRYGRRLIPLSIEWDHVMPFSYCRDNATVNFVAACQICNRLKSNKCFQTLEEAQAYVAVQRDTKERAAQRASLSKLW